MGDKIVQLVPFEGEGGQSSPCMGSTPVGLLWYGTFDNWGQSDGGPGVIQVASRRKQDRLAHFPRWILARTRRASGIASAG